MPLSIYSALLYAAQADWFLLTTFGNSTAVGALCGAHTGSNAVRQSSDGQRVPVEGTTFYVMTSDKEKSPPRGPAGKENDPDWANGLKRLYDSVVEEPLPDSFQDLLDQLDAKN